MPHTYGLFSVFHFLWLMLILFSIGFLRDLSYLSVLMTCVNASLIRGCLLQITWRLFVIFWLLYLLF